MVTSDLSDYEVELERTGKDIAELAACLATRPGDIEKTTRYVYRVYHRASLTADFGAFEASEAAIDDAIRRFGPKEDICLLKAHLDFKFHRVANVKQDLEMAPALRARSEGRSILADLDFQEGRYEDAKRRYEDLIGENRTWDNLARLAHFKSKMGDMAGADQLYLEAEDELTAKEMRSYAWLELQRGVLDLTQGRYADASAHYTRSEKAYSGYWQVDEHMAELLAAQSRFDEAAALYQTVIARVSKPELLQTLGELYDFTGRSGEAQPWYEAALARYLESAECGDVHYYHHLTDFYADVRQDGVEAVKWARKDLALRTNFSTQAALAWALYRNGQYTEALDMIHQALCSGARDAEMFLQAGMIHRAAGQEREGLQYLQAAAGINPKHDDFHVHR